MESSGRHERQLPAHPFKALHANTYAAGRAEAPNGLEQCLHLDSAVVPAQTTHVTSAAEIRTPVRCRPRAGGQHCRRVPDSRCECQVATASISEARHCVRSVESTDGSKSGLQPRVGFITIAHRVCASDDAKAFGPLVESLWAIRITIQGHREIIGTISRFEAPNEGKQRWSVEVVRVWHARAVAMLMKGDPG